ncbi:MAG TPA: thiamine phosphate synthase [Casimicrobiaceae bacterium]|nr:thiamine phosphate synthase [Casimicrobiaceae bacterium]
MCPGRTSAASRVRGLYAVTPDSDDTDALVAKVAAAIEGGAAIVQYRNKTSSPQVRRSQAQALAKACKDHDALFIVNDDPKLAHEVAADGVHVGADDGDIAQARAIVGDDRIVGVSCYDDFQRACHAVSMGADYVAFGSFFASSVKPGACRANVELLHRGRALRVPLVAIGGITSANAKMLVDAGASAVAVISDLFAHEDISQVKRSAAAIAALFPQ